ncbi:MAG: bifunctional ornithine acetyltransferase/N-acetylglutamate synthase [Solirubrobacteraceae bacterium]
MSVFASRWVDRPPHVTELDVTALPAGFRAAGVAAGLKPEGRDVGVLFSEVSGTVSAARFTTNARVGAPVIVSRAAALHRLRAVVANSGGSNTGDGQRGVETARATQALAAQLLDIDPAQVGVASTGVIGTELPREPLLAGVRAAVAALGHDSDDFTHAILTSDSGPKRACVELPGGVRVAGQVKGAGMISPRYATTFCFIETDAELDADALDRLAGRAVERSFNRISVDGQLSTSDTFFVLANGASGVRPHEEEFAAALDALALGLALAVVSDGEGTKRVGRIVVRGEHAEQMARAVANSPLVKTALHGADPNFGRILQAAGMEYPAGDGFPADLEIEGRQVVAAGEAIVRDLRELDGLVRGPEIEYRLTLPGAGEAEVFFADLSPEYVHFNAEYTS